MYTIYVISSNAFMEQIPEEQFVAIASPVSVMTGGNPPASTGQLTTIVVPIVVVAVFIIIVIILIALFLVW